MMQDVIVLHHFSQFETAVHLWSLSFCRKREPRIEGLNRWLWHAKRDRKLKITPKKIIIGVQNSTYAPWTRDL